MMIISIALNIYLICFIIFLLYELYSVCGCDSDDIKEILLDLFFPFVYIIRIGYRILLKIGKFIKSWN